MKLEEFNSLTYQQKSDLVWEWGYFITSRKEGQINIALFLMNDFLVHVKIESSENKTIAIEATYLHELHEEFLNCINHQHPWVKSLVYKESPGVSQAG